jgi:Cu/Ag efflux pump CusA
MVSVMIPAMVQRGVVAAFSGPAVTSYLVAVLVSMLAAVTLTPALASLLLRRVPAHRRSPIDRWLGQAFRRHVARHLARPAVVLGTLAALAAICLTVIPQATVAPALPVPHDRDLLVRVTATPSTSLQEMDRITGAMGRQIRALPGVRQVGAHVGRAITSDQVVDVNSGELWVDLAPNADYGITSAAVRRVVAGYPGLAHQTMTYEQQQVDAAAPPRRRALDVRVYGHDLGVLRAQAARVSAAVARVPGVVVPQVKLPALQPTLEVRVRLADAQRHDLRPGDVRRAAATLLSGLLVGNLYENNEIFDVVVWGSPATRGTVQSVRNLLLDTPDGGHVRLGRVATVRVSAQQAVITHDEISRHLDVTADIRGSDPGAVDRAVTARLESMRFPMEYHAEVIPADTSGSGMKVPLPLVLIAVLLGVFLILQAATRSWRLAAMLLVLVPLGAAGGVLVGLFTQGLMTAGGLAGLFLVLAFTVRNCLLLIADAQAAQPARGPTAGATVAAVTGEQVTPMLTTAAVIAVAVLPFTVLGARAGFEVLHPFGLVVLGGLISSVLLTVLVVPASYLRLVRVQDGDAAGSTTSTPGS